MRTLTRLSELDWIQIFELDSHDTDYVVNWLVDAGVPCNTEQVLLAVLLNRLVREQEKKTNLEQDIQFVNYDPTASYTIGTSLIFPYLDNQKGKVVQIRNGYNPDLGDFEIIDVECTDEVTRSFVNGLQDSDFVTDKWDDDEELTKLASQILLDNVLDLQNKIVSSLLENHDLVRLSDHWFPVDLLVEINDGHLNLVEAALYVADGQPLSSREILERLDISDDTDEAELLIFSLNNSLNNDNRFEDVGPVGKVLWFLTSMKPQEIIDVDKYLLCHSSDIVIEDLSSKMQSLSVNLCDEFSNYSVGLNDVNDSDSVTLIYPHLRAGTLPLNHVTSKVFPSALVSPRVKITLVDSASGNVFPGWVIQQGRYVWGLKPLYEEYDVVVGAQLSVEVGSQSDQVIINITRRNPIKEWVKTLMVDDGKILFELTNKEISVNYLDEFLVYVENSNALDKFSSNLIQKGYSLEDLVKNVFRSLSLLMPQGNVHAATLYSAINTIVRVSPESIFAILDGSTYYVHVGDAYWKSHVD